MTLPQIVSISIFLVTFAAILSERIDRMIVAMAGAGAMIAAGITLDFYHQEEALEAIDYNTLGLLLGMMIIVAILSRTGFFEYLAVLTAKRSKGNPWMLLVILGTVTTLLSMVLDNVTTIVLIAPVTILIAEIMGISPIPFLISGALLSNTGGVATLVGDPPNILIGSAAGLTFNDFLVNLFPIVVVAWLGAIISMRFLFRKELQEKPADVDALQHLDEREALKDPVLLRKTLIVLAGVVLLFFLERVIHFSPAMVALSGAATILLWVQPNVEELLKEVEWTVLLFFGALFVVVGGLEASGVLAILAESITTLAVQDIILTGVVVIWASAILSAIVDNIPFTIVMIPIIRDLGSLGVDIGPLWWALALGAGFGGNGTPIGSTANIITIKLSERTRHPITTALWLRKGLPVMLVVTVIGTVLFVLRYG
jgi:Na+/H+ antiporter NhaD/arsenite permease-like protein